MFKFNKKQQQDNKPKVEVKSKQNSVTKTEQEEFNELLELSNKALAAQQSFRRVNY